MYMFFIGPFFGHYFIIVYFSLFHQYLKYNTLNVIMILVLYPQVKQPALKASLNQDVDSFRDNYKKKYYAGPQVESNLAFQRS